MDFKEKLPVWKAEGVEPPLSKQENGWSAGDKPPADWFNYMWNKTYKSLEELREVCRQLGLSIGDIDFTDIESALADIKKQLDGKAPKVHGHKATEVTDDIRRKTQSEVNTELYKKVGDLAGGEDLTNHINDKIKDKAVHGIRVNAQNKLEFMDKNGDWVELKGGGKPVNITRNVRVMEEEDERVGLSWTDPDDIKIDGVTVAKWRNTAIVRKQGSKPRDLNDGVIVGRNSVRNQYQNAPFIDTQGLVNDRDYYYGLFPTSEDDIVTVSDNSIVKATPTDADDHTGSPGPNKLQAGTMQEGFFGFVPASELINGRDLANKCGITEGTLQNNDIRWLKFAWKGKILFRPQKPIRYGISWDHINSKGCVYGKNIDINGNTYKVRLMRGALTDPSKYSDSDRGAKGSEYNRLVLPLHEQARTGNWDYKNYVESNLPDWGVGLTNDDLGNVSGVNGNRSWCMEKTNESGDYRVIRGSLDGASDSDSRSPDLTNFYFGWAPVLELVE